MNYKLFEDKIISKIERNKNCNKTLKENQKLINEYFVNQDNPAVIECFVGRLNDSILKAKKYDAAEKLLRDAKSDILVRACEQRNKKAGRWLVTMNINPMICDKKGMTALMYAVTYWDLEDLADRIIRMNEEQINVVDKDGYTALFHAVKIKSIFDNLVKYNIDTNYKNKYGDTIFTHICRKHKPKLLNSLLMYHDDVDFSVVNADGKTGAMYLAESDNYTKLRELNASGYDLNLMYRNGNNETIVSSTINRIYDRFKKSSFYDRYVDYYYYDNFKNSVDYREAKICARTLNALIDMNCDFNCVVDGDGNTPMSFFLMIKDYVSALNLLQHCKTIDLNICNKYGISAAYIASQLTQDDFNSLNNIKEHLFIKINYDIFHKELVNYPSYNSRMVNKVKRSANAYDSSITPYLQPEKVLSLQVALSEGYLARNGEDGNPDLFDKIFGPILIINENLG
ncbi:hypothetical protein PIROE2DRAFT_15322 [Piromyces sp. E2]|nr:hypothetical protein PIROE2DRAFT_15322 [Piromyces sp. E2]|eukprot:OUM59207.1 hypothetical protein PIROE2DRAFT_15322 [Piromyces sp. E2]